MVRRQDSHAEHTHPLPLRLRLRLRLGPESRQSEVEIGAECSPLARGDDEMWLRGVDGRSNTSPLD